MFVSVSVWLSAAGFTLGRRRRRQRQWRAVEEGELRRQRVTVVTVVTLSVCVGVAVGSWLQEAAVAAALASSGRW